LKRLILGVPVSLCCVMLFVGSASARAGSSESKPTITLAAANKYAKDWAAKAYAQPRVFEGIVNRQKVVATFTLEKIEPCRFLGGKGREPYFRCKLQVRDLIQQENGYESTTTVHEVVGVVVDKADIRKLYEGASNLPIGVYPLRNPYRVFVYDQ
jgi:hypothetical protein